MSWSQVGTATVGPQTQEVLVGLFPLEPGDDSLWVRIQQLSPATYWQYAYGILTWKSAFGKELGSVKCYGDTASEVFRLGNGATPIDPNGSLYFSPRAYNRRWISIENPPEWKLNFEAQSGVLADGSPVFGTRATLGSLADLGDTGVSYAITDGFARVKLNSPTRIWPTFDSPQLTPTTQPSFPSRVTPRENSN